MRRWVSPRLSEQPYSLLECDRRLNYLIVVQDVAEQIDREARRRGRKTQVLAMDAFDLSLHQKEPTKAIFIASTTGQVYLQPGHGSEPTGMKLPRRQERTAAIQVLNLSFGNCRERSQATCSNFGG